MNPNILISTGGGDPSNYLAALKAAGAQGAARYLPAPDLHYDGLLLAGGGDMEPARFGQPDCGSRDIDPARDGAELALLDAFFAAGKPVLALCRGFQVVNVWLGGDLVQDLSPALAPFHGGGEGDRVHPVHAVEGSLLHRLYGPVFSVNSAHHQALGRLGRGLSVTARSEGGVAEAVEHETLPLIAVQFHPERMTGAKARPDTVDGGAVFRAFLNMVRNV